MSLFKVKKWSVPFIMSLACAFGAWAQTPIAPVLSSPTNGAIGQAAALTLQWGSVDTAVSYTVQVSTSSTFAVLTVNQPGLTTASYAAAGLTIGIEYYWQVSATSAADSTGPWLATWSFSTLAVPATPTLAAPANAATGEPTSLTLTWNAAARATSYEAQVSVVSTFATTVLDQAGLTALSVADSGLSVGTLYYWRVDANNSSGTSAWATVRHFTTIMPAPMLTAPTNGATGEATSLMLYWGTVTGAVSYSVQVSAASTFAVFAVDQAGLTADSLAVTGLANATMYYWRANATNGTVASAWTTAWTFSTGGTALTAPVLSTPTNASTGLATALTLMWDTVSTAASYSVQISTVATFAVFTVNQSGISATSYAITGLAAGATYYWQVNAANDSSTSVWSTTWHFATLAIPATPTLAAPANAATGEPTSLTLTWNAAARATSYEAQVSVVSTFATTVFNQAGLTALNAAVSGLASGATYYWHVDASDAAGSGAFSAIRSFTTGVSAPVLMSPAAGATGQGSSVPLTWGAVNGAISYNVQISTNFSFTTTVSSVSGITGASLTVTGLANDMTYFWQVEAVAGTVTSAWSAASWFTIGYTSVHSTEVAAAIPSFAIKNGVISYSLKRTGQVELAVFDLRGRNVFAFNRTQSAGNYSIELANRSVAPGRYFVWFKSGDFVQRTATAFTGKH